MKIQFKLPIFICITKFFFHIHEITSFKVKCLSKSAPNVLVENVFAIKCCNAKTEAFMGPDAFLTV